MGNYDTVIKYFKEQISKYGMLMENDIITTFNKYDVPGYWRKEILEKLISEGCYISLFMYKSVEELIYRNASVSNRKPGNDYSRQKAESKQPNQSTYNPHANRLNTLAERTFGRIQTPPKPDEKPSIKNKSSKSYSNRIKKTVVKTEDVTVSTKEELKFDKTVNKRSFDRLFEEAIESNPQFKGLIADGVKASESIPVPDRREGWQGHHLKDEARLQMIESFIYDTFLFAYRKSKKNAGSFEEILSDVWLILCETVKNYTPYIHSDITDYIRSNLTRKYSSMAASNTKSDYSLHETGYGCIEDIMLTGYRTESSFIRRKTEYEQFISSMEEFVKRSPLTDTEKFVIFSYFGFNGKPMTDEQIGKQLDRTHSRVQQIRSKACKKLYHSLYVFLVKEYQYSSKDALTYNGLLNCFTGIHSLP